MTDEKKPAKKNVFVTGVPRSGSTLFSKCLDSFPDMVCQSEVWFNPFELDHHYEFTRKLIDAGEPIPNNVGKDGKHGDNLGCYGIPGKLRITKPLTDDYILAHKGGAYWMFNIEKVIREGYPILAIIRDPVPTICSWGTPEALRRMPLVQMCEPEGPPQGYSFWHGLGVAMPQDVFRAFKVKEERHAYAWNCLAAMLLDLRKFVYTVRYEDIVESPDLIFGNIAKLLDTPPPTELPDIKKLDVVERYGQEKVDRVREAVEKVCSNRKFYDYD